MKNNKIIIFDFDGVFVDNFDFHKSHIEEFLSIEIDDDAFYNIHSGNVYEDDNIGLDLGNFDAKKYCQKIKNELVNLPMISGMEEVVIQAQALGETFIVSSGCEDNIKEFFNSKDICEDLCTIYGVETNPSKERKFEKILKATNLEPENAIFVTDTLGDILEANAIGVASIAVTWGFQRVDTLEEGAPFGFASSSNDIIRLVKEYFK